MERYTKQEKAGQGTYGVVYKSLDKQDNQFVALKVCCDTLLPYQVKLSSDPVPPTRHNASPSVFRCLVCFSGTCLRVILVSKE